MIFFMCSFSILLLGVLLSIFAAMFMREIVTPFLLTLCVVGVPISYHLMYYLPQKNYDRVTNKIKYLYIFFHKSCVFMPTCYPSSSSNIPFFQFSFYVLYYPHSHLLICIHHKVGSTYEGQYMFCFEFGSSIISYFPHFTSPFSC